MSFSFDAPVSVRGQATQAVGEPSPAAKVWRRALQNRTEKVSYLSSSTLPSVPSRISSPSTRRADCLALESLLLFLLPPWTTFDPLLPPTLMSPLI